MSPTAAMLPVAATTPHARRAVCRSGTGTGTGPVGATAAASARTRTATPFSTDPVALSSTLDGVPGEYTDAESGLQYLRARYYDPATAQFLTRDPIEGITGDPYGYTGGNAIMRTDPAGLDWNDWMPSASDVAAASAGIGDAMSFGLLKGVRNSLGGGVNECSDSYRGGGYAGTALGFVTGGEIRALGFGFKGVVSASRSPFRPTLTMGFAGRHTGDQQALVELAKASKKSGLSPEDAQALRKWADEVGLPSRGPEIHPNRNFDIHHIHVGPVGHIPTGIGPVR